jgi:hypothetical protein
MSYNVFPAPSNDSVSFPFDTTSYLFKGYSSKGSYSYNESTTSGSYIFYGLTSGDSNFVFFSKDNKKSSIAKSNTYVLLNLTTTESKISIWNFGNYTAYNSGIRNSSGTIGEVESLSRTSLGYRDTGQMWFNNRNNQVWFSTNFGVTWVTYSSPGSNPYGTNSTLYDGTGYWIGFYAAAHYSTNGTTWTSRAIAGLNDVNGLAYKSGFTDPWVAVGNGGIRSSTNGTTWTTRGVTTLSYRDVIAADDRFVTVGFSNGTYTPIAFSTNGTTWTTNNSLNNVFGSSTQSSADMIVYGNGNYVVAGYDGTTTSVFIPKVAVSTDLINWKTTLTLPSTGQVSGLAYNSGLFIFTGTTTSGVNVIWTSPDGTNWSSSPSPTAGPARHPYITGNNEPKIYFRSNNSPFTQFANSDVPTQMYVYSGPSPANLN